MNIFFGIIIPFMGTTIGAASVFLLKNKINTKIEKVLLGFASGVMIAASIFSLIIPSIDMAKEQGTISFLPASIGFMFGILFLILIDQITYKINNKKNKNMSMMMFAITVHNIPEGMAVGVAFLGVILKSPGITFASAFVLALGVAIQNFPEGAIISLPLKSAGKSKSKSFFLGMMSGIVEPIGAILTILLGNIIISILPYLLSFAAGAMIYVVVEELLPECKEEINTKLSTLGVGIGFVVMMILDVVLS